MQASQQPSMRKTKIVSTMGPACAKAEVIESLVEAGVNVFRLNFSFGTYADMEQFVKWIKAASEKLKTPVSLLGDLQGPKFRTGEQETEVIDLKNGDQLRLAYAEKGVKGNRQKIVCPHEDLVKALRANDRILIYDGAMEVKVKEKVSPTEAVIEVVRGGPLRAHKGLNVPTVLLKFDDMLPKDKADALWILNQQLDYVGMSFVQTAEDITRLRNFWKANIKPNQRMPLIIAKIEKPQALEHIDAIVQEADGLMVARGDLGVELSLEMVPVAQKMLIKKANEARVALVPISELTTQKPVITATQMLQSMTTEDVPTRAEVSDVANAVYDGTDAVMTSQETSMSPHPALVVQTMAKIVTTAEAYLPETRLADAKGDDEFEIHQAVALAALDAARKSKAKAIIVFTDTGNMSRYISKGRPGCPIICVTPNAVTLHQQILFYGVRPVLVPLGHYVDTSVAAAEEEILNNGWLKKGDRVVLCSGTLEAMPGLSCITKIYDFGAFLTKYATKFLAHHEKK